MCCQLHRAGKWLTAEHIFLLHGFTRPEGVPLARIGDLNPVLTIQLRIPPHAAAQHQMLPHQVRLHNRDQIGAQRLVSGLRRQINHRLTPSRHNQLLAKAQLGFLLFLPKRVKPPIQSVHVQSSSQLIGKQG